MTQQKRNSLRETRPIWQPVATDLITRLRRHHSVQADHLSEALERGAFDRDMAEDETLGDVFARFRKDQADEEAQVSKPIAAVPTRQLLTGVRLAAAFVTKEALATAQTWRSISVLSDIDAHDVDLVCQVLKACFPDSPWTLMAPSMSDGAVGKAQTERFWSAVEVALDAYAATLIIVPAGLAIPDHLRHAGLPGFRLGPATADILIAHLRSGELWDAMHDEAAFRQALPDDRLLAGLGTAEICTALRAPRLAEVLTRLAAMTQANKTNAPRLEEIAGDGPALQTARRLVADLLMWKAGTVAWSALSRSVLFFGPPGTGKTWLARAMSASAGIAGVTGSFAEWQSAGHLGDMLREMRKTFAEARRLAPCILFIDEIDAVGSRDSSDTHNGNYRTQVINAFLGEMNSIAVEAGIIVVGACNNIDRIDAAILRAGRFDMKVEVPLPDAAQILGLLRHELHDDIPDPDLMALARAAVGRSPAAIDAAIRASRSDARHERIAMTPGMLRRHLSITADHETPRILWRVALHEAGHAVVGTALKLGRINSMKITDQGGEVRRRSAMTESLLSDIEADICYDLAGRAAERLVLGSISAGAGGPARSDLAEATGKALRIETVYGLGVDGPVWLDAPHLLMLQNHNLRGRVRQRIERAEQRAGKILAKYRTTLESLARELMSDRSMGSVRIESHLRGINMEDTTADEPPGNSDTTQSNMTLAK